MALRSIQLRWPGRCCLCGTGLPAGDTALFDAATHEISCLDCPTTAEARAEARHPATPAQRRRQHTEAERQRVQALIADARAALAAARHAG